MNPGILKIKYFHNIQEVPHLLLKFESTSKGQNFLIIKPGEKESVYSSQTTKVS